MTLNEHAKNSRNNNCHGALGQRGQSGSPSLTPIHLFLVLGNITEPTAPSVWYIEGKTAR
jgi:hypothetical protein